MDADGNKSPVDAIYELRRRTPCRNLSEPDVRAEEVPVLPAAS
jgi:hypothetical protein